MAKAKKDAGIKLELTNARRDQSSTAKPVCSRPIENVHALMVNVKVAKCLLMEFDGRAKRTHAASARRSTASATRESGINDALLWSAEDHGEMSAADAVCVDKDMAGANAPRVVRYIIQVAARIWAVIVDSRRSNVVANDETCCQHLHCSPCAECVTAHRFYG